MLIKKGSVFGHIFHLLLKLFLCYGFAILGLLQLVLFKLLKPLSVLLAVLGIQKVKFLIPHLDHLSDRAINDFLLLTIILSLLKESLARGVNSGLQLLALLVLLLPLKVCLLFNIFVVLVAEGIRVVFLFLTIHAIQANLVHMVNLVLPLLLLPLENLLDQF